MFQITRYYCTKFSTPKYHHAIFFLLQHLLSTSPFRPPPMVDHGEAVETVITEATCTENGKKHLVCSVCGKVMKVEVIPFTEHTMSDTPEVVTEPTFTSKGLERYKCTKCDEITEEKELPSSLSVFLSTTAGKVTVIAVPCALAGIILLSICLIVRKRKRK